MKNILKKITLYSMLFFSVVGFSQGTPPGLPGDDGDNPPAAPIDDYIPYLIILGILVGVYFIKKKKKSIV